MLIAILYSIKTKSKTKRVPLAFSWFNQLYNENPQKVLKLNVLNNNNIENYYKLNVRQN